MFFASDIRPIIAMIPSLITTHISDPVSFDVFKNNIRDKWIVKEHRMLYVDGNHCLCSFVFTGCNGNGPQYYEQIRYCRHKIELNFSISWCIGEWTTGPALRRILYGGTYHFPRY